MERSKALKVQREELGLAQKQSKLEARRAFLIFICLSAFSFQLSAFLIGCAQLEKYPQAKGRLSAVSIADLKGLSKVDIVKKLGEPLAVSKSDVCESWYYARPYEIWVWFDKNKKVERWEVK